MLLGKYDNARLIQPLRSLGGFYCTAGRGDSISDPSSKSQCIVELGITTIHNWNDSTFPNQRGDRRRFQSPHMIEQSGQKLCT